MKNNKKIILYLCVAIFGILGVYLTFFAGGTDKYDSEAKAYKIYPNESYDSDDGTTYRPIYYFKVDGKEYECQAKTSSSSYPNENKNTVYYDSADPTNCKTEYEKTSSRVAGIICLITTAIMIYLFFIKKVADNSEGSIQGDGEYPLAEETAEKIIGIIGKVQLIYKRVIIGIIIIVLLVFILIDTILLKQTIKARDYIETTATYAYKKDHSDSESFDDYVYVFIDKEGKQQEIIKSLPNDDIITPESEIKVKYNENDPQDYYEEGSMLDKKGIIWYIVKIVALILLIVLFLNKKILSRINISASANRD